MWWPWKKTEASPSQLEERLEKVERGLRALGSDWLEFEEKVQRKVWRDAKRSNGAPDPEPPQVPDDPRLRGLDPVSRRIVMLRRGGARPTGG